MMRMVFWWYV